jgi:hypothetical protein
MLSSAYVHDRYLDAEERYEIFVVKSAERPHLLHWTASTPLGDATKQARCSDDGGGEDDENNNNCIADDEKKIEIDSDIIFVDTSSIQSNSSSYVCLPPPPPLTDGCDIPGWRSQRIAPGMNPNHHHHSIRTILQQRQAQSTDNDKNNNSNTCDSYNSEEEIPKTRDNYNDNVDNIEFPLGGSLNIGAGSTLTRLESQFPFVTSSLFYAKRNNSNNHTNNHHLYHRWRQGCCCCWWHHAKQQYRTRSSLSIEGRAVAPTIEYEEAKRMVDYCSMSENEGTSSSASSSSSSSNNHSRQQISYFVKEYEIKNRPVKIVDATKDWLAMPSYAPSTSTHTTANYVECEGDNNAVARCCNQSHVQDDADDDINNENNNLTYNNASSLSSWRDVGEESILFQGGGKGGWT